MTPGSGPKGADGLNVGQRIALLREGLGESPAEFAAHVNVRLEVLQATEAGTRQPPTRLVHQVARYVGKSPEYVVDGDGSTGIESRPGFVVMTKLLAVIPAHRVDPILTIICRSLMEANRILALNEQPKESPTP